MAYPAGTTHCSRGHVLDGNQNQRGICRPCLTIRSQIRRATPEGKTERVLEHLKLRGGLSLKELQRAKPIVLEFFQRPPDQQICPICGNSCYGRKKMAGDHNHETQQFRDMICQECNVVLGQSHERDDLLGNGKLGQYLQKHKERYERT